MATNTAQSPQVREHPLPLIHFMRKTVNYNTAGIADGVDFANYLPSGASILFTNVKIKTAFNAGTTNVLTVGYGSGFNNMVAAGDVNEAATGSNMVLRGADLTLSADQLPKIKYTQTGTAASAGQAEVIIAYVPNTDQ